MTTISGDRNMGLDIAGLSDICFYCLGIVLAESDTAANTTIYQQSLGMNVNLIWGVVLGVRNP